MRRAIFSLSVCLGMFLIGALPVNAETTKSTSVVYNLSDHYSVVDLGFVFDIGSYMANFILLSPGNSFEIEMEIVNDYDHAMVMPANYTQVYAYAAKRNVSNAAMSELYRSWLLFGFKVNDQSALEKRALMSFDEYEIIDVSGVDAILSSIQINNQAIVLESGESLTINISFEFSYEATNITQSMSYALVMLFPFEEYQSEPVIDDDVDEPSIVDDEAQENQSEPVEGIDEVFVDIDEPIVDIDEPVDGDDTSQSVLADADTNFLTSDTIIIDIPDGQSDSIDMIQDMAVLYSSADDLPDSGLANMSFNALRVVLVGVVVILLSKTKHKAN